MHVLLTNSFELPPDNWYQISSLGEFKHNPTGFLQIIDEESCRAMVERFNAESGQPNFPGILIDFDHFSLDHDKPSEAAGWIAALQQRPDGLWAQIRWTDKGEEAVRGGRYRFISPVFRQDECLNLGNNRIKPQHLVNAAVTNDPNISGMVPLSNKKADPPVQVPRAISMKPADRFLFNRALALIANGGRSVSQMEDDQRKAVFARMRGGGGGGGGYRNGDAGEVPGEWSGPDYSSSRNTEARVEALQKERKEIESKAPGEPPVRTFDKINTRELERQLLKEGASFADIKKRVAAAEEHNKAVQRDLHRIKASIKAKYKDPNKQKAALDAYLDKIAEQNSRALSDYAQKKAVHDDRLSEVDRQIDEERIRQGEAKAQEEQRHYNDDVKVQEQQRQQAIRDQVAADKTRMAQQKKQEAQQQKEASPEYQLQKEKAHVQSLKSLWQNAANGDEQSVLRDLRKLGVDPAQVDMPAFIKEASSVGVVGRDASYQQRQRARQDKANAYNRPIPTVDGESLQVVPRSTLYAATKPSTSKNEITENTPVQAKEVESFQRYQKEYDEIKASNQRGAMADWQAKKEIQTAWDRHQRRIGNEVRPEK
ncbi:MAG TPA: hypothetical protein DCZ95_14955 [Verrucomicrobia bacterium]|nr:MAG: hypothetical protein A2X46_15575 [Lentisphaerae bacterium GWF2_57_35]HBA85384.1 hypothetical protein [Verrucomicrobiota bacterium]